MLKKFGPRGVIHSWAVPDGTQRIEDTGPLTRKRMKTVDDDTSDRASITSNTYHDWQIDRAFLLVPAQAAQHLEWKDEQPFKGVLKNDVDAVLAGAGKALIEPVMATHAGMTTVEFEQIVRDWIGTARHSGTGQLHIAMVFQPMPELLDYLRPNDSKTYIVPGGGIEFMRPWVEALCGVPPEQVIGSRIKVKYELREGEPVLRRLPEIDFIDDKAGKPVGIHKFVGLRPIAAFGNSDGDLQMLQWTAAGDGSRFMLLVHHTDAEREYAQDRKSHVGKLDQAVDEAERRGCTVVDMKCD